MPNDEQDPFGEYVPELPTEKTKHVAETEVPDEVESVKYGVGKPRRIFVRGIIAADKGPEDDRE